MKIKIENLSITYDKCKDDGIIKFQEDADVDLIKSLLDSANRAKVRIKKDKESYEKETNDFTFMHKRQAYNYML